MKNTNIPTIFLNDRLEIWKFSPSIAEIFRLKESDIGKPISEYSHRFFELDIASEAQQSLSAMDARKKEVVTDGGDHYLFQTRPYYTARSGVYGIIVNFINVERIKIDVQRATEFRYLRDLSADMSPNVTYVYDLRERKFEYFNKAIHHTMGYVEQEILDKDFHLSIVHPDDLDQVRAQFYSLHKLSHHDFATITVRIIHKDGVVNWYQLVHSSFQEENAKTTKVLGVAQSIHELANIKIDLAQNEERLKTVFNSSPIGIILTDIEGKIFEVNQGMCNIIGYQKEELLQMSFVDITDDPEVDESKEKFRQLVEGEVATTELEKRYLTKDHQSIWCHSSVTRINRPNGQFHYVIAQIVNIHERKLTEIELNLNQERLQALINGMPDLMFRMDKDGTYLDYHAASEIQLAMNPEHFMGKRMHDIWPKDLADQHFSYLRRSFQQDEPLIYYYDIKPMHSDKPHTYEGRWMRINERETVVIIRDVTDRVMAERDLTRMNIELERFAYLASHDLKEPLRTITTTTHRFKENYESTLDDRAKRYLSFIEKAGERMTVLVQDLLEYSQLKSEDIKYSEIDLKVRVQEILELLQSSIEESGVEVVVDELPVIRGESTQITMLFQNVISNAIKYRNPKRALSVQISSRELEHNFEFAVKDNGIGIEEKNQSIIFEVFKRLHNRNKYAGTGIGLANCRRIVQNHGGKLWVESELGKGSTFFFTIPKEVNSFN